jgi:hypothetical protein
VASAEQLVLFDVTFTYTWEDAAGSSPSKSHFYVNDGNVLNTQRPDNWLSPVDYRNGSVHVRVEVIDKPPGDQTGYWSLCYVANQGSYGCTNTGEYTAEGLYEKDVDMTSWWQNDQLDWAFGVKQMDLVYKKSSAGSDHIHNFPELKDVLTPTTLRITMVQVSDGDTYDESTLGLDFGGGGGSGGNGGAAGAGGAMPQAGTGGQPGDPAPHGGAAGMAGGPATSGSASAGSSGAGTVGGTPASQSALPGAGAPTAGAPGLTPSGTTQDESCSIAALDPAPVRGHVLWALAVSASVLWLRRVRRSVRS